MLIAKLILHFNTPELTLSLLEMVPEAIVIDCGSTIDFQDLAPNSKVLRFEKNLGFTPNWNRALKILMNDEEQFFEAFWLMNSDIEISRESISRIQFLMDCFGYAMITPTYNCWMKACKNNGSPGVREVKCIEFTAPVIRRDVFDKIGYFDNHFVKGYGVEFDWSLRMQAAGLKQYCDDKSFFYHIGQQSINANGTLREYETAAKIELQTGMTRYYGKEWKNLIMNKLDVFTEKPTKKKVAVYTTIFDSYANLIPMPKQSVEADYFCITDCLEIEHATSFGGPGEGERWKIIPVDFPTHDLPPRLRAKFFKLFPWEAYTLDQYDIMIYIDGSIEVTSPDFIRHCLDSLGDSDMALYAHPNRDCIYEEAIASRPLLKYLNQNLESQVSFYSSMYPRHGGLFACGVMVRRIQSGKIRSLMGKWWWEIIKWTYQDQLSFPVVCKLSGFSPNLFPGNQYKNSFFKVHWHDDNNVPKKRRK